jgi:hypothetical protein
MRKAASHAAERIHLLDIIDRRSCAANPGTEIVRFDAHGVPPLLRSGF